MLVGSQLAPVVFQFFSFLVLMPVRCGKPNRVCFLYISIWMAPKCSCLNFQYNVCSEIHHHLFIIVSSFCQGSLPCAAGNQDSKEIGCIIVDRCIDFLNVHGLLAY